MLFLAQHPVVGFPTALASMQPRKQKGKVPVKMEDQKPAGWRDHWSQHGHQFENRKWYDTRSGERPCRSSGERPCPRVREKAEGSDRVCVPSFTHNSRNRFKHATGCICNAKDPDDPNTNNGEVQAAATAKRKRHCRPLRRPLRMTLKSSVSLPRLMQSRACLMI